MTHATFSAAKVRAAATLAIEALGDRPHELEHLQRLRDFADLVDREASDKHIALSITDAQRLAAFFPHPAPVKRQRTYDDEIGSNWKTI